MAAGLGLWIEGPWRSGFQQGYVTNMVATSQLHGRRVGLGDFLLALTIVDSTRVSLIFEFRCFFLEFNVDGLFGLLPVLLGLLPVLLELFPVVPVVLPVVLVLLLVLLGVLPILRGFPCFWRLCGWVVSALSGFLNAVVVVLLARELLRQSILSKLS